MATLESSKRRATCWASASIAVALSVVKSTSRVRSNRRVTSFRRAMASRARSCAAADRLLAITATTRNANKAIQFCGSAIVKVPTGGRKKKFNVSIATIDIRIAIRRRATVAAPSTTSRSARATVVGLMLGNVWSDAVTATVAARLAMKTAISRAGRERSMVTFILPPRERRSVIAADFLPTLYGFLMGTGSKVDAADDADGHIVSDLRRDTRRAGRHSRRLSRARSRAGLPEAARDTLRTSDAGRRHHCSRHP